MLLSGQPVIQFTATDFRYHEAAGTADVTLVLNQPSFFPITVRYSTSDASAHAGTDYTATSGTVTFAPTTLSQSFTVPLLDDGDHGSHQETADLALSDPTNATLGSTSTATLTILDDAGNGHLRDSVTTLTSSLDPADFGSPITLTAQVSAAHGDGHDQPSGTVEFLDGTTELGTGALDDSGQATFSLLSLAVGDHALHAVYQGDVTFGTSTGDLTQTIAPGDPPTMTSLSVSPGGTQTYGQSFTFTASVMPMGSGSPTGTVTFKDGTTTLQTVTVTPGTPSTASYSTSSLAVGSHTIYAYYNGDSTFTASNSGGSLITVNQATTTTSLSSTPNPSTYGQSVTFSATVASQYGATVSGTVTFKDALVTVGTGTVSGGVATYTTSTLAVQTGGHNFTAVYGGDTNDSGSTSSNDNQMVNNPVPAVTSISPTTAVEGAGSLTLTVNGSGFMSNSTVQAAGVNLTTTYVSSTQLTATLPSTNLAEAGTVNIGVSTPSPGGGTSGTLPFSVADAAITITSAPNPTAAAGSTLTWTVTFTDANGGATNSDFKVLMKWGDGTDRYATITGSGPFTATGTHAYDTSGAKPLNVVVTDDGGASDVAAATATITPSSAWDVHVTVRTTDPTQGSQLSFGPIGYSPDTGHVHVEVPLDFTQHVCT